MYLLTLILGIVLLHEASTLQCYECIPGSTGTCTETTKQCPSLANRCAALRMVTYAGGSKLLDTAGKSCALSEECGEYSVNFGVSRVAVNSKCCTTDLCNTQLAAEPSLSIPNGKKCFTCDGLTCTSTLNCLGNEDHCISATVNSDRQEVTLKGCASKAACSDTVESQIAAALGTKFSCCQGDYCNSASSTTASTVTETTRSRGVSASSTSAGLLLLVTLLISLILN